MSIKKNSNQRHPQGAFLVRKKEVTRLKKELKIIKLNELQEYENNPRLNEGAVAYVGESIKQVGYISPIIVDEDNVILAGHTRLKALLANGADEAEVIVVTGMSEGQKRKFRILDNKTNEFAGWDFEKLEEELDGLDFEGFDFGFGEAASFIDDLLEDAFSGVGTNEDVVFAISFNFPKTEEEYIKDYVKKVGKDTISQMIVDKAKEGK